METRNVAPMPLHMSILSLNVYERIAPTHLFRQMINEEPSVDGCVFAALWLFLLAILSSNKCKLSRTAASKNNKISSCGKYLRADSAVVAQKSRRRIGEDERGWELDGSSPALLPRR